MVTLYWMAVSFSLSAACSGVVSLQAVMVAAYECRLALLGGQIEAQAAPYEDDAPASVDRLEGFYTHLEHALIAAGFLDGDAPRRLMPRLRRLFARARPSDKELDILRGILAVVFEIANASDVTTAVAGFPILVIAAAVLFRLGHILKRNATPRPMGAEGEQAAAAVAYGRILGLLGQASVLIAVLASVAAMARSSMFSPPGVAGLRNSLMLAKGPRVARVLRISATMAWASALIWAALRERAPWR